MISVLLNGCSSNRGASGSGGGGVSSADTFIADSIKKIETDEALWQTTDTPYNSLTEASVNAAAEQENKNLTLQALAVQGNETINYTASGAFGWSKDGETKITVALITLPTVSLTFDDKGKISGVKAYFADQSYEVSSDDNDSATHFSAEIKQGAFSDATIANLTLDRTDVFGFDSNYMAHIGWHLERALNDANPLIELGAGKDRSYDITGNMIAGLETNNADIPNYGDVTFVGKGRGYFSHVVAEIDSYATIFDITADIDFFAQTADINSTNTQCAEDDVSICTANPDALDFRTGETFIYIINNQFRIRGDIALKINDSASDVADNVFAGFVGTIDAHFFGTQAQELGGIFAMRDETGGYYYGAFGGERESIEAPNLFNVAIAEESLTVAEEIAIDTAIENNISYASLTALAIAGDETAFTVKALSVYKDDITEYIRAPNRAWDKADTSRVVGLTRLGGSAASLTFDDKNNIAVTLYTNDTDINDEATINVERGSDFFGFDSNYMAYIDWKLLKEASYLDDNRLNDSVYNINGAMLAGIETADLKVLGLGAITDEAVAFSGKGRGTYGNFTESYDTIFEITATVNFSARNLMIASNNTCKAIDCDNEAVSNLNFSISSTPILYNSNHISGNVSNANYGSAVFDARFYGTDAWEFGGTFAITYVADNSYYYGAFGTARDGMTAPSVFNEILVGETVGGANVSAINNAIGQNSSYSTLTEVAAGDGRAFTMNALTVYKDDTINYTRAPNSIWATHADKAPVTSIVRVSGSASSLTFDGGNVSKVTAYLNDVTYTAITADAIDVERGSDFFGFDSNYMAYIGWDLEKPQSALDNNSNDLSDKTYIYTGGMLVGIETANSKIPLAETREFKGKGRGVYGDNTGSYGTIFDVTAIVNFGADNVDITTSGTACTGSCDNVTVPTYLDFNTGEISYRRNDGTSNDGTGNDGISSDAINAGVLSGTLDARFYGNNVGELGGAFALAGSNDSYYYGVFGALRGVVVNFTFDDDGIATPLNATIPNDAPTIPTHPSDSIIAAITDTSGTADRVFTMRTLAVSATDKSIYERQPGQQWVDGSRAQTISIANIANSAASLTINGSGELSNIQVYLNDNISYTASATTPGKQAFTDNISNNLGYISDSQTITLSRDAGILGFDANNMVYIGWNITDALPETGLNTTTEQRHGMMIAGIESVVENMPDFGTSVEFTGKGRGTYGNRTTSYATSFDMTAEVDFATSNVTLNSRKTCKVVADADCGDNGADRVNNLNFETARLSFIDAKNNNATVNNISGALVETTDKLDSLTGTVDARFYGDDAWEFGGTFALSDNNSYYYGAFGALRSGITAPSVVNETFVGEAVGGANVSAITTAINSNNSSYDNLNAVATGDGNAFTMNALTVYKDDTTNYTRAPNRAWSTHADTVTTTSMVRLSGSASSLTFSAGNVSKVTAYLNDATYTATTADSIDVERGRDFFGFDSNYMAYIGWNLEKPQSALNNNSNDLSDKTYIYTGAMLVGIETLDSAIPLAETREFKGKGRGVYGDAAGSYDTIFAVTADVNFADRNVTIASSKTCKAFAGADCTDGGDDRVNNLNFSTVEPLSFAVDSDDDGEDDDAINLINTTDLNVNGMIGTLDARFYGAGVSELGGTFALANSSSYYYGVFGGERGGIKTLSFESDIADKTATLPSNITISTNHSPLTEAVADDVVTMNALSVYKDDTTQYTRASTEHQWATDADKAQTISIARLTGSAASLTFGSGNTISGITLYTNDTTGINNSATIIGDKSKVERGNDFFGFDSNYMAYISWEIDNDFNDNSTGLTGSVFDISGAMLAGIETSNIGLKGEVEFKGKGRGTYGDATGNYDTIFDVTASVDFGNQKNVTIRSLNTCKAVAGADCTDDGADRVDNLNFNALELGFTANNINVGVGDSISAGILTGTLDARFYGDKTREFGGTFALASISSYYYGVFGAERGGITEPITLNAVTNASVSVNDIPAITTAASLADVKNATFTVRGLAAYQDDSTSYERASQNKDWVSKADKAQTVKIARLTGSAASLTFDVGGNVSSVTAYADAKYTNATADRSTMFGFASNDMAYISWGSTQTVANLDNSATTDTITNIDGAMLAGIETDNGNILTFGASTFTGKGRGTYGVIDENNTLTGYDTVFNVTASVDFATDKVTISSSETCEVVVNADCVDNGTNRHDFLNFSTEAITYTGNSISGDNISDNVALTENNQFSGTLDARFYGYVGREFGGTFALSDANSYYYGAFGANREALYNTNFTLNQIDGNSNYSVVTPVDSNDNEYVSIYNAIDDTGGTANRKFIMRALAVSAIDKTDYVRESGEAWDSSDRDKNVTLSRVRDSYASLTIDGAETLSAIEISLGDGFTYTANASSPNKTTLSGNITGTLGLGTTTRQKIRLFRDEGLFGFKASDMVFIDWEITEALPAMNATVTTANNIEKRHGMMIAGLETEFAHIPTANPTGLASATFRGKGRGIYGNIADDEGFQTRVILTANVDFAVRKLNITGSGTVRCSDASNPGTCTVDNTSFLNFKASGITYSSNNISGDVALTANPQFSGRLDARFYGDGGHKFGGTFALNNTDGSEYYYGAFGAQRTTPVTQFKFNETLASESGPKSTLDFLITNQTDHDSLHAVAITDGSNSFTMNGLAVYQSNQTDYARVANKKWGDASTDTDHNIAIGRLSDSGAAIIFDGNGNISGIATYLSLNPYIATNIYTATIASPISATDVVGQTINSDDTPADTTSAVMNIYRGESFFGFKSYYMSYIDWQVTRKFTDLGDGTIDRSYDYSGAMLAGIATKDARISNLTAGIFTFKGKGRGFYHNSKTGIGGQTIFDVTANVNFGESKVTINSSNTIACGDFSNIGSCTSNVGEFSTGAISYSGNNISGAVGANIAGNSLTGTLDARFYSDSLFYGSLSSVSFYGDSLLYGSAQELGGIFAMTGGDYYYYGAFGAEINYVTFESVATDAVIAGEIVPTTFNQHNLTGFDDSNRASKTNNALPANAVQITRNETVDNKAVNIGKFTGAVVEIDYEGNGDFDEFSVYFADKKYSTTNTNQFGVHFYDVSPTAHGTGDTPNRLELGRQAWFGFAPTHMAMVYWKFNDNNDNSYDAYGYGITGFETVGTGSEGIPTTGIVNFTGRGRGSYYDVDDSNKTFYWGNKIYSDVRASVNFVNRKIGILSYNTCSATQDYNCVLASYQRHELDFKGTLSYANGDNNISGTIATVGDGYTNLAGTADAKFYGTGADSATEFGGTFSLYNNNAGYVGYFGAEPISDGIATTVAGTPTSFNHHNLTAFKDENRGGKTNNALQVAGMVQITKQKTGDEAITTERFTGAVVEIDYAANGGFAGNGLKLYFANKKYSLNNGSDFNTGSSTQGLPIVSDGSEVPDYLKLSINVGYEFYPEHMAMIEWKLDVTAYGGYGLGITGYETVDNNIPTTGNITFIGRGEGYYYDASGEYTTDFDVAANVNFANRIVNLTSSNTCISLNGCSQVSNQRPQLNLIGMLSYASGTNISGVITTAGGLGYAKLSGTADAKFYGPNAKEFGGTFAMQNDDAGYVGYFGLRKNYSVSSETLETNFAGIPTEDRKTLSGFNDSKRSGKTNIVLKANTAVQRIQSKDDQTIIYSKITGAVAEFDYDADGYFNGLRFYFDDKKYSTTGEDGDDEYLSDHSPVADGTHDDPDRLGLSREDSDFGFKADYMVRVGWSSYRSELTYKTYGYAMTGFETAGTAIPIAGNAVFTGEGVGLYNTAISSGSISFDLTANVNFASRSISLISSHYYTYLDFTGILRYDAGTNIMTGAVVTAGDDDNAKLYGTAEAHFYGTGDDAAIEFGGTFSFSNDDNAGYVGWFGGKRGDIIATDPTSIPNITTPTAPTAPTAPSAPTYNHNNLTGFADDARKGTSNNKLLAIAASVTKNKDKTVSNGGITTAAIEFDYASNGDFTDGEGFTLHLPDRKYSTAGISSGKPTYILANSSSKTTAVDINGNNINNADQLGFSKSVFGFTAEYMAAARWRVTESSYETLGYAITGFDTIGTDIPTIGAARFIGKGFGQYYDNSAYSIYSNNGTSANRYYKVTANVNFATRNVVLTSENTCSSNSASNCAAGSSNLLPHLDFTGNLSYAAGKNAITGNIETAGGAGNIKLSGTAEARFYGPAAQEFGGTFSLSNATSGYVGWFGAKKADDIIFTSHADTPTTFNANNLTSMNDSTRKNSAKRNNNAFKATAVQITKQKTGDKAITTDRILGAVAEWDYKSNGSFANDGGRLYFADKKYQVTASYNGGVYIVVTAINSGVINSGDADTPYEFWLTRGGSHFGFSPAYMAMISWRLNETAYASDGYAIAGFETDGSSLPAITGTNVSFAGKGRGRYHTSMVDNQVFFNVTANVNFATRNVSLASTNTCTAYSASSCTAGSSNRRPHLDWTGELSYAAGVNNISGTIETAGDADNTKLTGRADARFYGPATEELGGTFRMSNATSGYIGYFGAKK